jgi:hypothetical protein
MVILRQYRQLRSAPAGAVINMRSIIFGMNRCSGRWPGNSGVPA